MTAGLLAPACTVHMTMLAIEHEPVLLSVLTISIPGSGMSRTSTRACSRLAVTWSV
jgi:hypothetical protein